MLMPLFISPIVSASHRPHRRAIFRKRPRPGRFRTRRPHCCAHFSDEGSTHGRHDSSQRSVEQDYAGWSAEFLALCRSQLELLADSIAGIVQGAIFFRSEHPPSGALEFVPLVVLSAAAQPDRVWIGTESASELEVGAGAAARSRELPGGIPAARILPDYPFVAFDADGGIVLPDGGLCVPVEYNDVFAGSVVLWRDSAPGAGAAQQWLHEEVVRVRHVARSIALGATLEGKVASAEQTENHSRVLIESIRSLLRSSMHQIRSPIAALVTFGHLLLRKLPPGDSLRGLAKNIVVESLRLDDLLDPLDQAQKQLILKGGNGASDGAFPNKSFPHALLRKGAQEPAEEMQDGMATEEFSAFDGKSQGGEEEADNGASPELVWVSDILEPIANSAACLAQEKGLVFVSSIDDDTPPVCFVERDVREAVYNLVDNAMRYTPVGGYVGLQSGTVEDDDGGVLIEVLIWDTGPGISDEEHESIWKKGRRGQAAAASGMPGSGMGLAISRDSIINNGGTIEVHSPLPAELDPRGEAVKARTGTVFCLRFPRASMQ